MLQNGDVHGRPEKQANLFSKGHVEHEYWKELGERESNKKTEYCLISQ